MSLRICIIQGWFVYPLSLSFTRLLWGVNGAMSINAYCLNCSKPVAFRCACCATAGYCSKECQKKDWCTLHRHEQIVMSTQQHTTLLTLDASQKKPTSRHRDAYVRPLPVRRRPKPSRKEAKRGHNRGFTKAEIESELQRQTKYPKPVVEEEEPAVQGGMEPEEPVVEQMQQEVVRNSMPAALQAFVDEHTSVIELRDRVLDDIIAVTKARWGDMRGEQELSAEQEQLLRSVFRDPEDIKRENATRFIDNLAELATRMDAFWAEEGDQRRVQVTEQHKTAITHYLRMAEVCQLKWGVARLSGHKPYATEARWYQLEVTEFNDMLTHSIFFEDLGVDYAAVVRQMDTARVQEFGRQEGALIYRDALDATAAALAAIAADDRGQEASMDFHMFKGKKGDKAEGTFLRNLKNMFSGLNAESLKGNVTFLIKGLWALLGGQCDAQYDYLMGKGELTERYAENSKQLVAETGHAVIQAAEEDEEDQPTFLQRLADRMPGGRERLDWLSNNKGRVAKAFVSTLAIGLCIYAFGRYVSGAFSVRANLLALMARLGLVVTAVQGMATRTREDAKHTNEVKEKVDELMKEQSTDHLILQEFDVANTNLTKYEAGIGLQLNKYAELVLNELVIAEHDPVLKNNKLWIDTVSQLRDWMQTYPEAGSYEKKQELMLQIQAQLKGLGRLATNLDLATTLEAYADVLKAFKAFVDRTVTSNADLIVSLNYLEEECTEMGTTVAETAELARRTEIRSPFTNHLFAGLAFDTSRLSRTMSTLTHVFSFAVTALGVTNAILWLGQCEDRAMGLVDLWANATIINPVGVASSLGASLFSPSASVLSTIFYFTNAIYAFGYAADRVGITANRLKRLANWVASWQVFSWPGVAGGWLREWFSPGDAAPDVNKVAESADVLQEYENEHLRADAKNQVDNYFEFEMGPQEIIDRLNESALVGRRTDAHYGLAMSYLRDELLRRQLNEAIALLPAVVEQPRTGAENGARSWTLSAYAYAAEMMDRKKAAMNQGLPNRVFSGVQETLQDVYRLSGHFVFIQVASQLWYTLSHTGSMIQTLSSSWLGCAPVAVLALTFVVTAGPRIIREAVVAKRRLAQGLVLDTLIPLGAVLVDNICRLNFKLAITLYSVSTILALWDSTTWYVHLVGGDRVNDAFAWMLGWSNPVTLAAAVSASEAEIIAANNALATRQQEAGAVVTKSTQFSLDLLNTATVITGTDATGLVETRKLIKDAQTLNNIMIKLDYRGGLLAEETYFLSHSKV